MLPFLKDSVYANMAPLFIGPNLLIVSKEPKAKELLSTLRGSPQMTLLGMILGCVHAHEKPYQGVSMTSARVCVCACVTALSSLFCSVQARVSTTPC